MKLLKTLLALVALLLIIVAMAQTVPGKSRHKEAMMEAVTEFVESEAAERGIADNALTRIGKNVALKAVETALNSKLKMHDYFIFNTTYVKLKGDEQLLSVGLLGMVFTFDKKMLREKLEEATRVKEEADSEREAAKQSEKELKELEKEKRKREKELEKERKRQERDSLKEVARLEKEARKEAERLEKEQERLEKEARKEAERLEKESRKEAERQEKEARRLAREQGE